MLQLDVFNCLESSPHARLERRAELGDGLVVAQWRNRDNAQQYVGPSHHTLSCYLEGGNDVLCCAQPHLRGGPGKVFVFPAGVDSSWVVNSELRLLHLYFSTEQFALACMRWLDREPRALQLNEGLFLDDALQAARFAALARLDWQEPGERLVTSSLAHDMLGHALLAQAGPRAQPSVRGGLSGRARRQVIEYIETHLPQALTLGELAAVCGLSEYHFARMFRQSLEVAPHRYVLARRLARAQHLLQHSQLALGEVAMACGFASASHFSSRFRQCLGTTPGAYRLALA
ncbi:MULTISPECIES: helix-turn-helix domain-containing protein [unclassified Pseudomonas]|uniref:helix-turn-helix domain-containing protein n=1 Tax=unclassified Pseudomonas TaxID=196821 RepID=UPI000BDC26AE|nr:MULTISPECIES: AraC family transcriptional regulator [unclassified Pseudomonas]PVZ16009.1 AraC family transcriptional regulator [Pseudomonas sp. URIL14HWK12:I12]PVZ26135.1 AraC family transcriptional regulator [Pseudomonas sp. URIL14HWK12:I10]PVZ36341.1 AraC family transcriptional regulator [Pseudomonas sp. URIL14HWK12:I11]SNZ18403.1 transcriptional regulator, AraC family [Pseudomonas sp. URIL14HWK12:I9]